MDDCITIAENERRFVAQELHDHAAQTLLQINMQAGICKKFLEMGQTDDTLTELKMLEQQIHTASRQIRELISDLRPPRSDDGDFPSMLRDLIETHHQRGGPPVRLSAPNHIPLFGAERLALSRIIQEILLNIRKHAQAAGVNLTITTSANRLQLTVVDDGVGFDDALIPNPLAEKGGAGMVNMHIRAGAIGGELEVKSQINHGTMIQVTFPL